MEVHLPLDLVSAMKRIFLTIEAHGFTDVEDTELIAVPAEGDLVETKYGTCIVTRVEATAGAGEYDGRIVCRMP
jgi:hypothetical protein